MAKISELVNPPHWLLDAKTEDADVELLSSGYVIWKSGTWYGGTWYGGTWYDGTWEGGTWEGGTWEGGTWEGGTIRDKKVTQIQTCCIVEGFPKTLCNVNGIAYILAGCQFFTLAKAKEHWKDRDDRKVTRALLMGIEALVKEWGLKMGEDE